MQTIKTKLALFPYSLTLGLTLALALSPVASAQDIGSLLLNAQGATLISHPLALGLPILGISSIERNSQAQDEIEESFFAAHATQACGYLGFKDYLAYEFANSDGPLKVAQFFGSGAPLASTEASSGGPQFAIFTSLVCTQRAKLAPPSNTLELSEPTFQGSAFEAFSSVANLNAAQGSERDLLPVANAEKLCSLLGYADVSSFEVKNGSAPIQAWDESGKRLALESETSTHYLGHIYTYAVYSKITCTR